uniref:BTB domain-containing protein n=1 Tax=Rhabditophanes sp. KR3021 TaxID=114890 RepID=A0AC35THT5_9BILA
MSNLNNGSDLLPNNESNDLKIVLKDGFLMTSKQTIASRSLSYRRFFLENPDAYEVECKSLTVDNMTIYLQFVDSRHGKDFVNEENFLQLINVNGVFRDGVLFMSLMFYYYMSEISAARMVTHARENSYDQFYEYLIGTIKNSFE